VIYGANETRRHDPPGLRQGAVEDDLRYVLGLTDQIVQIIREGVRGSVATVGDITTDEVAVANVYDEIVFAGALATFDDPSESLHTEAPCKLREKPYRF
jgi:hypothetical protein